MFQNFSDVIYSSFFFDDDEGAEDSRHVYGVKLYILRHDLNLSPTLMLIPFLKLFRSNLIIIFRFMFFFNSKGCVFHPREKGKGEQSESLKNF